MSFPDNRLLNQERKVKDRSSKERRRKGTKHCNESLHVEHPDISRFENRILCGDSEELLKELPDGSIDVIVTSPPYNFGLDYSNQSDDTVDWEAYFDKLNRIWIECARLLVRGGRFIVNVQPLFSDYIPTHHVVSRQLAALGLLWKGEILWEKNNYNCKYTAWGSWKSPSMPYLKYTWEFVEIFCKESHKKSGEREEIDITGDEFKKWVYARWSIPPERNMKRYNHPAMFPEELATRLLKLFSYRNDIALDPFCGTGTAAVAAKNSGRRYVGIDISREYCAIAEQRLSETAATKAFSEEEQANDEASATT